MNPFIEKCTILDAKKKETVPAIVSYKYNGEVIHTMDVLISNPIVELIEDSKRRLYKDQSKYDMVTTVEKWLESKNATMTNLWDIITKKDEMSNYYDLILSNPSLSLDELLSTAKIDDKSKELRWEKRLKEMRDRGLPSFLKKEKQSEEKKEYIVPKDYKYDFDELDKNYIKIFVDGADWHDQILVPFIEGHKVIIPYDYSINLYKHFLVKPIDEIEFKKAKEEYSF